MLIEFGHYGLTTGAAVLFGMSAILGLVALVLEVRTKRANARARKLAQQGDMNYLIRHAPHEAGEPQQ